MQPAVDQRAVLERAILAERPRLVGLCARISGDRQTAEDLAQEALSEAWRHIGKLRDPSGLSPWLSAIARNVCLRWRSSQGRESSRIVSVGEMASDLITLDRSDSADVEVELERHELVDLLDRALALLPEETRIALVERYVEDSPHAEIAARLGISENAVKMRIQRGKLMLHRVLTTEFRRDALAFGLVDAEDEHWQETRIWCSMCGEDRLIAHFDREAGDFVLRCPGCYRSLGLYHSRIYREPEVFQGIKGYKAALNRVTASSESFYKNALARNCASCPQCGAPAMVFRRLPEDVLPRSREFLGMHVRCTVCDATAHISLGGLIAGIPEVQAFWRQHPRMRTLPEREIETDGRPAVLTQLASVGKNARIAVVVTTDSFDVLQIHRS